MKNCLEFADSKLRNFVMTFGVFSVLDVLRKFGVQTDVITLNKHYQRTDVLEETKFGAMLVQIADYNALNLKAQSDLINYLLHLIYNIGSSEEAVKINSALKCLCIKLTNSTERFYGIMSEALHKRIIYQKLCQVYAPLMEEVKANNRFLTALMNNDLMTMEHLQQLTGTDKIAHYIIHNVNNYRRLKRFQQISQSCIRDKYLIEQLEEIIFEIELFQFSRIEDKIKEDSVKTLCELY